MMPGCLPSKAATERFHRRRRSAAVVPQTFQSGVEQNPRTDLIWPDEPGCGTVAGSREGPAHTSRSRRIGRVVGCCRPVAPAWTAAAPPLQRRTFPLCAVDAARCSSATAARGANPGTRQLSLRLGRLSAGTDAGIEGDTIGGRSALMLLLGGTAGANGGTGNRMVSRGPRRGRCSAHSGPLPNRVGPTAGGRGVAGASGARRSGRPGKRDEPRRGASGPGRVQSAGCRGSRKTGRTAEARAAQARFEALVRSGEEVSQDLEYLLTHPHDTRGCDSDSWQGQAAKQ